MNKKTSLTLRKGKIIFNTKIIKTANTILLNEIFSNFYPYTIITQDDHTKTYYGYSPHFRELKSEEKIPRYEILFDQYKDTVTFSTMKELVD